MLQVTVITIFVVFVTIVVCLVLKFRPSPLDITRLGTARRKPSRLPYAGYRLLTGQLQILIRRNFDAFKTNFILNDVTTTNFISPVHKDIYIYV